MSDTPDTPPPFPPAGVVFVAPVGTGAGEDGWRELGTVTDLQLEYTDPPGLQEGDVVWHGTGASPDGPLLMRGGQPMLLPVEVPGPADAALSSVQSLVNTLVFNARDWAADPADAWLWGIIVGWDCDEPEHDPACRCVLDEVAGKHRWPAEQADRLAALREGFVHLQRLALDARSPS